MRDKWINAATCRVVLISVVFNQRFYLLVIISDYSPAGMFSVFLINISRFGPRESLTNNTLRCSTMSINGMHLFTFLERFFLSGNAFIFKLYLNVKAFQIQNPYTNHLGRRVKILIFRYICKLFLDRLHL